LVVGFLLDGFSVSGLGLVSSPFVGTWSLVGVSPEVGGALVDIGLPVNGGDGDDGDDDVDDDDGEDDGDEDDGGMNDGGCDDGDSDSMVGDGICMGGDFLVDCVMVIDSEGTVSTDDLPDGTGYVDGVFWLDGISVDILVTTGELDMLVGTMLSVDMCLSWLLDITGVLGSKLVLFALMHPFLVVLLNPTGHRSRQFKSSPELE
jgi:hypothetical protein